MSIYKTRFLAEQNRRGGGRVVKVWGGYTVMSCRAYQIWKRQR